jgi:hypothetical protein
MDLHTSIALWAIRSRPSGFSATRLLWYKGQLPVTRKVVLTVMTMTDPQICINAITFTRIVNDTIKEYRNDYARMRSYEIMAHG